MIPTSHVTTVTGEEATVMDAFERHAEVVTLRIEGIAGMGKRHLPVLVGMRNKDVVTAKARMTRTGKIKVAIRPEGRERLVTLRVDRAVEVLYPSQAVRCDAHAPNVETSLATRHVAREVKPLAIGRDSGMGKTGERVFGDLHRRWLAPGSIGTRRLHDLGITGE